MGKTLFWYLLKDLTRVFILAAIVLAGIMSFGGLLRPLTKHGLDAFQVGQMWLYLMPAMMTYSIPVAAVFATSIIYGRFTADNELTAARAAGISYGSIVAPALTLGLGSALATLLFLSYVVPFFSYHVEKVIYANVARVIASEIERNHSYKIPNGGLTVFARTAHIPDDSGTDGRQVVVIEQPMLVTYSDAGVPSVFTTASKAIVQITKGDSQDMAVWIKPIGGTTFTRDFGSGTAGGIGTTDIGPISVPPLLPQRVKFMDIARLKNLAARPEKVARVKKAMKRYINAEQTSVLFDQMRTALQSRPEQGYTIDSGETYQITAPGAEIEVADSEKGKALLLRRGGEPIRIAIRRQTGREVEVFECESLRIRPRMDLELRLVIFTLEMQNVSYSVDGELKRLPARTIGCTTAMSPELFALNNRRLADYIGPNSPFPNEKLPLLREKLIAGNEVTAEMNSRASFGASCLALVMVGAVLGMLFRSGDFLSAFAVSFIPALITITLVVAGSQMATEVPRTKLTDPMALSLSLIWAGNAISAVLAGVLFLRIRRT